jgi:hypothetical protein
VIADQNVTTRAVRLVRYAFPFPSFRAFSVPATSKNLIVPDFELSSHKAEDS